MELYYTIQKSDDLGEPKSSNVFFSLCHEADIFLKEKAKSQEVLSDPGWIFDMPFSTDITKHLNTLNLKLQGKGKLCVTCILN